MFATIDKIKSPPPPCGGCCTRLTNFGVSIGGNLILKDFNLHVHCGELTAIIGPNGAGKTTLLKAMLGEIPHIGEVHFVHSDGRSFGKPRIGYVPQKLDIDKTAPISVLDLFSSVKKKDVFPSGTPLIFVYDEIASMIVLNLQVPLSINSSNSCFIFASLSPINNSI